MSFVFIKLVLLPKMRFTQPTLALLLCALTANIQVSECQLSQDTFNIARGKTITASATCGYDLPPGQTDELFCKLSTVPGKYGISGLECDHCNPRIKSNTVEGTKDRHIKYAIDGTKKWWQSPPLSRGLEYNEINITIDLGQVFHVVYVVIKTANSPRPGTWILERSSDYGKTYSPWYYFAPSRNECWDLFKRDPRVPLVNDDDVQCVTKYSQIPPFENGEIFISLVNGRPSTEFKRYQFSKTLQDWMTATNVRLRLLRPKTLLGEYLPLAKGDPTVTRRYFYSIKDITIGGLCICNGYADQCLHGPSEERTFCQCQKNTCGPSCSECCPGFNQYKWKSGFEGGKGCEACNCFGHSEKCYYSESVEASNRSINLAGELRGGGVCTDCQDNTFGNNCQFCKHKFYNPTGVPMTDKNACVPCNCDERFSTGECYNGDGQCKCKDNYAGKKCDQCSVGFYDFPDCKPCQCNAHGTKDGLCEANGNQCPCKDNYFGSKCDRCAQGFYNFPQCVECQCDERGSYSGACGADNGQCPCFPNYKGRRCNQCDDGYYGFPNCRACSCDRNGATDAVCDKGSGTCICKPGFTGIRCGDCAIGYYGYPLCRACQCSGVGSIGPECDSSGRCSCRPQYSGFKCERCATGYYDYPRCIACTCDRQGSLSDYCNPETGQCRCKENFSGTFCSRCKAGYYGFPDCQECGCNPAGVRPLPGVPLGDCSSSNTGQCECKQFVQGQDCSECKPKTFNLSASNRFGCQECRCNVAGVIGGIEICDEETGKCLCKERVTSKRCEICKDGFYRLRQSNAFGCSGCNCDVGGSYSQICGKYTGQCKCRPNVGGRTCDRPLPKHYHADLFQLQSEIEDGRTPENISVRFRYSEQEFPGYSWRGYGVFSDVQRSVIVRVNAKWPENYHMVFHYVLNDDADATGEVVVRNVNGNKGVTQRSRVTFKPTVNGFDVTSQFVVVAENGSSTQFAMLDRQYDIQFTTDSKKLLLDYVSIVPVFYPGPSQTKDVPKKRNENVLEDVVTRPCEVNGDNELDDLCVQYSYAGINKPGFVRIQAEEGYTYDRVARKIKSTQVLTDPDILKELDFSALALLDRNQSRLSIKTKVPKSGKYVVLTQYFTTNPRTQFLDLHVRARGRSRSFARFRLPSCKYTFGCRTVGLSVYGAVQTMDLQAGLEYELTAVTSQRGNVAVDSFILVPYEEWVTDYIVPSKLCVTRMKVCTRTSYSMPGDAVMVEAGKNGDEQNTVKPPNIFDPSALLVYLEGKDSFSKEANLPTTGEYAIMVHYYQPYHTTVDSETVLSSATGSRRGKTSFNYCPNTSGCRTVVKGLNGESVFNLGNQVALNFKLPQDNNLWVDYILFVPKSSYSPVLATGEPVDRTNDFVEYCSKDNLRVTKDSNEFCTQSVFSLSTFYNNGTSPCECDVRGSRSDTCEVFGGQCPCFENIIGRACIRCKTGYYGFPNCRKCDCDNCDPDTGVCACPPNTAGADCTCVKGTFGYDPVQGCLPCDCDSTGVTDAGSLCDTATGNCSCLPNRSGRRCDECKPGYYGYPNCRKCDCNEAGSTGCDPVTGRCICKEYVAGTRCAFCKIGYYYLDGDNTKGCLECWCSGLTKQCDAVHSPVAPAGEISGNWTLQRELSHENATYFGSKMGDMTNAYGRDINIPVTLTSGRSLSTLDYPLALIESNGERIHYVSMEETTVIRLTLGNWRKSDGSPLTRHEFMTALAQVDVLHVFVSDGDETVDFRPPIMSPVSTSQVEKCICPANTVGLSCQDCSEGYFRSGDSCVPCQCNGHSSKCDPKTGECYDCRDNTAGLRCNECVPGYYGDPTSGDKDACQPCPCPNSSKNYATSCFQESDGSFNCTCRVGYTGKLCDECADGYFGDPLTVGCRTCECNGNIDLSATGNCDRRTGQCLRCVNNTSGNRCEKCQPGYYGNGILGNCQRCDCDACGSASSVCNDVTGECSCKPGVAGQRCTTCPAETWDFDSCNGCQSCGCSSASLNNNCDSLTGRCECKPGVTGLKCDRCDFGYFGYTGQECKACNCPTGQVCDVNDGKCCEPNDPKCEICPPYHIRTPDGCEYCGPCEERLLKRVDKMLGKYSTNDTGVATEESKKRLNKTEKDLKNLKKRVNEYNTSISNLTDIVNGKDKDADGDNFAGSGTPPPKPQQISLEDDVNNLVDESMNIVNKAMDVNTRSNVMKKNATKTKEDALDIEEKLRKLLRSIQTCPPPLSSCGPPLEDTCSEQSQCETGLVCCHYYAHKCGADKICRDPVINIKHSLEERRNEFGNTLEVLKDINEIRLIISGRNYSDLRSLVEKELNLSRVALRDSDGYLADSKLMHSNVVEYGEKFDSLEPIFRNQLKKASSSVADSKNAEKINKQASSYQPDAIIVEAESKKNAADAKLDEAIRILQKAKDILKNIKFPNKTGNVSTLNKYLIMLDERIAGLADENAKLKILVNNATEHANRLKNLSDYLQSLLRDPNKYAKDALKAVQAYRKIVKAIDEVLKIAREANKNSKIALDLSQGLGTNATRLKENSVELDNKAEMQKKIISELDDWLDRLAELIKQIRDNFETANTTLNEVKKPFPRFERLTSELGGRTNDVQTNAKKSDTDSKDAKSVVDEINVPGIKALEDGFDNAMELLTRIEKLVNDNDNLTLEINTTLDKVRLNQSRTEELIQTEVVERIQRIRFNIERGRYVIRNHPASGGEYDTNTSVELRIPEVAYGTSSQTKVSFDVATDQEDALLLFIGNAQEYLAFQIHNDNLQVVSKDSDGPTTIDTGLNVQMGTTDEDKWRNVIFERTGPAVNLTVGTRSVTSVLPSNVFDLKRDNSYLFVGKPPDDFELPAELKRNILVGGLDNLFVDRRRVGLYDALNYNTSVVPKQAPFRETDLESDWLQFFGNGYQGFYLYRNNKELSFRTALQDGIIILIPLEHSDEELAKAYLIIEMVNGTVGFRFNSKVDKNVSDFTQDRFDDNKKHDLALDFSESEIKLTVDKAVLKAEVDNIFDYNAKNFEAYLGGYNREREELKTITATPFFVGCIKAESASTKWDYFGVQLGCDVAPVSTAKFFGDDAALELAAPVQLGGDAQIGSMFKTSSEDGLLMNMQGEDGSFVVLSMEDGELKYDINLGGESFDNTEDTRRRRSADGEKLNNNKWHSFSVRIKNGVLEIVLNGNVILKKKLSAKAIASASKGFNVSLGGVANKKQSASSLVKNSKSLDGEIRDPMLIKGRKAEIINLSDGKKSGVKLGDRRVPYYEQPVGITAVPTAAPVATESTTKEVINPVTTGITDFIPGSGSTPEVVVIASEEPLPTTTPTTPKEPTTTPSTPTEPTTPPTTPTESITFPTTPTDPTTSPTTPTEPTTTPTTPTEPTTTPTTEPEPTTTPTTPTEPTIPQTTVRPTSSKTLCSRKFEYSDALAVTGRGYIQYKVTEKKFGGKGGLSFEFKTFARNGILFFSRSDTQSDFISCYLQDGYVYFAFDTGAGIVVFKTENVVNDGTWKKVTVSRNKVDATLTVDGVTATKNAKPGASFINGIKDLYFGGYFREVMEKRIDAKARLPISACFRRLVWESGRPFPSKPTGKQFVSKCYKEQREKSVYFAGVNSYMVAAKTFSVGRKRIISMDIKPRNLTGLILAAVPRDSPTRGDFAVLELNEGIIVAKVQNGDGVIEVRWQPSDGASLCDNKWHKIVVSKLDAMVSLQVDSNPPKTMKKGKKTIANVKDSLYLGGIPDDVKSYGIEVRQPYQGCIKNFRIKSAPAIELYDPFSTSGDVFMYGCPFAA